MQTKEQPATNSKLDGLWIVLVGEAELQVEDRIPVMARAGDDQTYLLGFKNVQNARDFVAKAGVEDAEPRMVVKGNRNHLLKIARDNQVAGVLVDYDPSTQAYAAASPL